MPEGKDSSRFGEQLPNGLRNLLEPEGRSDLVHKNQGCVADKLSGLPAGRIWSRGWTVSIAGLLAATDSCAEGGR